MTTPEDVTPPSPERPPSPGPAQISEQLLPPDEYLALVAAVSAAERPPDAASVALSCYLSASRPLHPRAACPPLLLTLLPRPRYPPALAAALAPLAHPAVPPSPDAHDPLHFHPARFAHLALRCAEHGLTLPAFPPRLARLAARLAEPVGAAPTEKAVRDALDDSLWPRLLPFQRVAVLHAVTRLRGRVLFADDMGMGKTLQALALAQFYRETAETARSPTLIVCPPTLRQSWKAALLRWLPDVDPLSVHLPSTPDRLRALLEERGRQPRDVWDSQLVVAFIVCSYDLMAKAASCAGKFDAVIVDECHNLRNVATARTAAMLPIIHAARVRVLVSGTPALSRPAELYPLLSALLHTDEAPFLTYDMFMARYTISSKGQYSSANSVINEHELNALLSSVMIRRLKADVAGDLSSKDSAGGVALPPKERVHVILELPPERTSHLSRQLDEIRQLTEEEQRVASMGRNGSAPELRERREALYASLSVRTAEAKIPGVLARLHAHLFPSPPSDTDADTGANPFPGPDGDCPATPKLLVFAQHLGVLDAVMSYTQRHGVRAVRIDGGTGVEARSTAVDTFQTQACVRVAALSLGVAAAGLTLTAADVVLFAELAWVPSLLAQAEDRAHRIGREGKVTVEYAVAPGTLDDAMMAALAQKANVLNLAVDRGAKRRRAAFDVVGNPERCVRVGRLEIERFVGRSMAWVGETVAGGRLESVLSQDGESLGSLRSSQPCLTGSVPVGPNGVSQEAAAGKSAGDGDQPVQ